MLKKVSLLLLLYLIYPYFLSNELLFVTSLVLFSGTLLFYRVSITKRVLKVTIPLVTLLILGTITLIGTNNLPRDILRDYLYFLNPIIVLALGYILIIRIKDIKKVFNTVVLVGVIMACVHLWKFISNPLIFSLSLPQIRAEAGTGYSIVLIALLFLIFNKKFNLQIFNNNKLILFLSFVVCFMSFALSLSRTLILTFLVVYLVVNIKRPQRKVFQTTHLKASLSVFALLIVMFAGYFFYPEEIANQLINKMTKSIEEISTSNENWDWQTINNNWRGYEAYMAFEQFKDASLAEKLIGQGFGTNVNTGVSINLGGEMFSEVPILHNGYMYILTKTGIVGVVLYLIFLINIIRNGFELMKRSAYDKFYGKLLISIAIVTLLNTYIVTGIFNTSVFSSWIILLGLLHGYSFLSSAGKLKNANTIGMKIPHQPKKRIRITW